MHECRRLVDKSGTNTTQIHASYFFKVSPSGGYIMHECRRLVDKSGTNTTKIRVFYFLNYVKMALGVT